MPSAISYAPESVVEKFQNFTDLGLDAVKILNNQPAAIGLAPESIHKKFQNFTDLGLDAVKILNALPPAIGYAPESIHKKFQNFTDLGLDAVKIINAMPSAISYAPESVLRKVRLLQCLAFRLQWQGSVNSLIEASPNLLGFNSRKLVLLGRLAATQASRADRTIEPKVLKSHLIMPLEQYLIALDKQISSNDEPPTMNIKEFYNAAAKLKLNAPDRKEQAKEIARSGRLGRIGAKYLKYAK